MPVAGGHCWHFVLWEPLQSFCISYTVRIS